MELPIALEQMKKEKEELELVSGWIRSAEMVENTEETQAILERYKNTEMFANEDKRIARLGALKKLIFQYETVVTAYPTFLKTVQDQSDTMTITSIFGNKNSFPYRNIKKTAQDFRGLENLQLVPMDETGFQQISSYYVTDIIAIIIVSLFCFQLLDKNQKSGMNYLIHATRRGNQRLLLAQILSIFFLTVIFIFFLYISNIIIIAYFFGFGDMNQPVQSMDLFRNMVLRLNGKEYLCLYLLGKIGAAFVAISLCILFCVIFGGERLVWVCFGGTMIVSFLIWQYIPSTPVLKIFRFLNF